MMSGPEAGTSWINERRPAAPTSKKDECADAAAYTGARRLGKTKQAKAMHKRWSQFVKAKKNTPKKILEAKT